MTDMSLEGMTTDKLVEYFTKISLDQYEAILDEDNDEFNRLYDDMMALKDEFIKRGPDRRRSLIPSFNHPNPQVRFNAAMAMLAIVPDAARQVLQIISDRNEQPQAMDARMIMKSIDAGRYIPT